MSSWGDSWGSSWGDSWGPVGPSVLDRYGRPSADLLAGSWLPSVGTDLFDMLDEATASAIDYIFTVTPSTCRMSLSAVDDPLTSTNQVVSYQAWSPNGNGLIVRLKQGAATIATWTHADLPAVETIYTQSLTEAECDSITNYGDLRVEFEATT